MYMTKKDSTSPVKVTIVHDLHGRIISINRPAIDAKVIVLPQESHSIFVTDVDPKTIHTLRKTHIVDVGKKALVPYKYPRK